MKTKALQVLLLAISLLIVPSCRQATEASGVRHMEKFTDAWRFSPGEHFSASNPDFDDSGWELLDLPHDWSISEPYHIDNPGRFGTSFMIGGVGWYRKTFDLPASAREKRVEITFDGVYQNSTVWINGHELGTRPFGYISFKYDLSPYLSADGRNTIAVRVDNSAQPNSRWYTGSGIYRNVWLTLTDKLYIDPWGLFVTTPGKPGQTAGVQLEAVVGNDYTEEKDITLLAEIYEASGRKIASTQASSLVGGLSSDTINLHLEVPDPLLWSVDSPDLYSLHLKLIQKGQITDDYITHFGIRYIEFDTDRGFLLNGEQVKIKGVCMHHDLGALGAAVNLSAMERQLRILQEMGCNAIRTAHNPPAPELLQLSDRMGFLVMNETFDAWKLPKTDFDYSVFWDDWHERDLKDHILRDRNHPSVIVWSIGNEILEQWRPEGSDMASRLVDMVRSLDLTRPITAGNNHTSPANSLIASGKLDLIGCNYKHEEYDRFLEIFPGQAFIATETTSALASRGSYDMPSDSIRRWPYRWDQRFLDGNPDNSCSAYDNCHAPWGSTHADTWKVVKKHDFLSGMFIWTGFDYLGEPTPYEWPSRSSYFGVVDLAGFPKDAYYMYRSEWSDQTVLHVFPHWNWKPGQEVDVWIYYNHADEVELFLNGVSQGVKSKQDDDLHVQWRLPYAPGAIMAISRKDGQEVMRKEIHTAGEAAAIRATPDRQFIAAGGEELVFITIDILDQDGHLVPYADNLVAIHIDGDASVAGVDNGDQTSHEPFQAEQVYAYHGKCLAIIRGGKQAGEVRIALSSEGLSAAVVKIQVR